MDLHSEVLALLRETGPGRMLSTAYDTAWVARLAELGEPVGEQALEWLRAHQLPDGSWGAMQPKYHHDRLICTLAALTTLARRGERRDQNRLRRALVGMDTAIRGLRSDIVGETIGFEMIIPTLLSEARALGAIHREEVGFWRQTGALVPPEDPSRLDRRQNFFRDGDYFDRLMLQRVARLERLPMGKVNRAVTVAFSAEMAGTDSVNLFDVEHLLEANGSVSYSPSATAYFVLYVRPGYEPAMAYLRQVAARNRDNGGIPDVAPFDTFELSWTLWNLALAGQMDDEALALCQPRLEFLQDAWMPGKGVGFAASYAPTDSDVTSLAYEVLSLYGRPIQFDFSYYEQEQYFRCFQVESNPSVSANVHVLGALRRSGLPANAPQVQKVLSFLQRRLMLDMLWFDKWHASPYYPTTHAVIACAGYADSFALNAVHWILETQNVDGSWGYYGPTAEETAYCLQALLLWRRSGKMISKQVLQRGLRWLAEHRFDPYPPLWIGKCLYVPVLVVRSAILSALMLGVQEELL